MNVKCSANGIRISVAIDLLTAKHIPDTPDVPNGVDAVNLWIQGTLALRAFGSRTMDITGLPNASHINRTDCDYYLIGGTLANARKLAWENVSKEDQKKYPLELENTV